jgi:GNAT superfamily N-acetyltransferase
MVYVEYLATHPENREPPIGIRALRGVATILVAAAVRVSIDLGFDGRVGLHSTAGAESFYGRLGFQPIGRERCQDGEWLYLEHVGGDA